MWSFSNFRHGFRSSRLATDLFTVVSNRIARVFNRSGAILLHKLRSYGISDQIFGLISSFLSNRQLRVVLDGKSSQEYIQLMLEFVKAPSLILHFSYYTLMTLLTTLSVILISMLIILLFFLSVIRHLICGNRLNWLLNLNLIYETLWTGVRSGLLISMLGKLSWFRLTGLITMVLLM